MPNLNVLLISGSLRDASTNSAVLRTAASLALAGMTTAVYDGMGRLPHFNPDDDREGQPVDPAVAELRMAIRGADGLLFCTPEYAGALPGSFKNLLEWTVGDGCTYQKPVAWINAAGPAAPTGGGDAHDSLRKVLGYVHANIVERACVRIPITRADVDADGTISRSDLRERIATALQTLAVALGEQHAQ